MSWYKQRFAYAPKKIEVLCAVCFRKMYFPKSKSTLYKTCGEECRKKLFDINKSSRMKLCKLCGKPFVPRKFQLKTGVGKYCSIKCSAKNAITIGHLPEANKKRTDSLLRSLSSGAVVRKTGKDNPCWKGGRIATRYRRVRSGKAKEQVRKYRAAHPEKMREWASKRKNAYLQRLPYGTVKRLIEYQGGLCVFCKKDITKHYYLDHIFPISKGGKHEPENLQILCQSCNCRKHNKTQEQFMKEFVLHAQIANPNTKKAY